MSSKGLSLIALLCFYNSTPRAQEPLASFHYSPEALKPAFHSLSNPDFSVPDTSPDAFVLPGTGQKPLRLSTTGSTLNLSGSETRLDHSAREVDRVTLIHREDLWRLEPEQEGPASIRICNPSREGADSLHISGLINTLFDNVTLVEIQEDAQGNITVVIHQSDGSVKTYSLEDLMRMHGEWFYEYIYPFIAPWIERSDCSTYHYPKGTSAEIPLKSSKKKPPRGDTPQEHKPVDGTLLSRPSGSSKPEAEPLLDWKAAESLPKELERQQQSPNPEESGPSPATDKPKDSTDLEPMAEEKRTTVRMRFMGSLVSLSNSEEQLRAGSAMLAEMVRTAQREGFFRSMFSARDHGFEPSDSLETRIYYLLNSGYLTTLTEYFAYNIPYRQLDQFTRSINLRFRTKEIQRSTRRPHPAISPSDEEPVSSPLLQSLMPLLNVALDDSSLPPATDQPVDLSALTSNGWQIILAHEQHLFYLSNQQKKRFSEGQRMTGSDLHQHLSQDIQEALEYVLANPELAESILQFVQRITAQERPLLTIRERLESNDDTQGIIESQFQLSPLLRLTGHDHLLAGSLNLASPSRHITIDIDDSSQPHVVVTIRVSVEFRQLTLTTAGGASSTIDFFLGLREVHRIQTDTREVTTTFLPPSYIAPDSLPSSPTASEKAEWLANRRKKDLNTLEEDLKRRRETLDHYKTKATDQRDLEALVRDSDTLHRVMKLFRPKIRKAYEWDSQVDEMEAMIDDAQAQTQRLIQELQHSLSQLPSSSTAGFEEADKVVAGFQKIVTDLIQLRQRIKAVINQTLDNPPSLQELEETHEAIVRRIRQDYAELPAMRRALRNQNPPAMTDAQYERTMQMRDLHYLLSSSIVLFLSYQEEQQRIEALRQFRPVIQSISSIGSLDIDETDGVLEEEEFEATLPFTRQESESQLLEPEDTEPEPDDVFNP